MSCRSFAADAGAAAPKAAALIIGNEILNGSITDTNTPWLAKLLHRFFPACALSHMVAQHACPKQPVPIFEMQVLDWKLAKKVACNRPHMPLLVLLYEERTTNCREHGMR